MDSVLCAVGVCKGRRHWECSQGRLCVEERLSHWVLKHKQEVADAKARGQSWGGAPAAMWLISRPPGSGGLFLLSLWRWQILQPRAPAVYQGPSQGQGLPLPAAEAVGPWLRKQLRQGTQGRGAERTRRPQWGRGREPPERKRVPCRESQGEGQEQTLAGCASRACPCPLLPRVTPSSVTPLIHQTFPDGFLQDSFLSFAHLTRLPVTTERVNSGIRNHSSSN